MKLFNNFRGEHGSPKYTSYALKFIQILILSAKETRAESSCSCGKLIF